MVDLKKYEEQWQQYSMLITNGLSNLGQDAANSKRQKEIKSLELHHFAAFVIAMVGQGIFSDLNNLILHEITEEPDFVLKYHNELVGLELRRIVNDQAQVIGIQKGILRKAEALFKGKYSELNLLVNIDFSDRLDWKAINPKHLAKEVSECIFNKQTGIEFQMPYYLNSVRTSLHEPLSFNLCGSYWVGELDFATIEYAIREKGDKIEAYRSKHPEVNRHWLLLVISGASPESSFRIPDQMSLALDTEFDKVFLLNDFEKKVYVIK